jgi:hypothetical protein
MITQFRTKHDSLYEIDHEKKTWKQLEAGHDREALGLRTTEGTYLTISDIVIGQRVSLVAAPFVENATFRLVSTSPVRSVVS